MDEERYRGVVDELADSVLQAINRAASKGMSRNVACGIAAAIGEVIHATRVNGNDASVLATVKMTAMIRHHQGIG